MNKKIIFVIIFLSMFLALPAYSGQAIVSPEEMANYTTTGEDNNDNNLTTNDFAETYDGNTVEIIEVDDQNTIILMNDTYELEVHHNGTSMGVSATILDPTPLMSAQADEFLFDIEFNILPSGKFLEISLPTAHIALEQAPYEEDVWHAQINEELYLDFNSTERSVAVDFLTSSIIVEGDEISYTDTGNPANNFVFTRIAEEQFIIMTPDGIFDVLLNETHALVDWVGNMLLHPFGAHTPFQHLGPVVSVSFVDSCVMIEWEDVVISIHEEVIVLVIDFIVITWYFLLLIEMLTIFIWDITIIFYLVIVELIIVIIYETIEIKIYETQVVIVYQYIEIIFLFISVILWQLTFIFHFEFWFIEIFFLINIVTFVIINQVRIIFIPIVIPVFFPVIYYVPVIIKEYVNVYVPYASPQLFIDVESEVIDSPNCTLQYFVYDVAGIPVDDATVIVNYNGYVYPATFLGNGVYEVVVGTAETKQSLTVTATKAWYPDGVLTYDLNVTRIEDIITTTVTETAPSPLPIISILASLFAVSIGTMIINKKKKK